jgi:hypothetical protein
MSAALEPLSLRVISLQEPYAEKIRAASCRCEAAIRNLYDLDHALEAGIVRRDDTGLLYRGFTALTLHYV